MLVTVIEVWASKKIKIVTTPDKLNEVLISIYHETAEWKKWMFSRNNNLKQIAAYNVIQSVHNLNTDITILRGLVHFLSFNLLLVTSSFNIM